MQFCKTLQITARNTRVKNFQSQGPVVKIFEVGISAGKDIVEKDTSARFTHSAQEQPA